MAKTTTTAGHIAAAGLSGLLLLSIFWAGLSHDDSAVRMQDARLPNNAQPHAYQLDLTVDPKLPRFSGVVTITLALRKTANQVLLHGRDLNVTRIEAILPGGRRVPGKWKQLAETGLARLDFDDVLPDNIFQIQIAYDAPFGKDLVGLYRVQVDTQNYAFTQFESTDARAAFPCFDEPRFKTPFRLSLTTPSDSHAVSNTSVRAIEAVDRDNKRIVFNETARLPTYLVAFAIGQFDIVEAPPIPANDWRERPIPLRGIAIQGHGANLQFLLQRAQPLLIALERYFGVQYPFEKLDILVVPESSTDGMENAALPTFSERSVGANEHSAISEQREVIRQLSHELSHQWFGNLVTMPWWNDLWLKESFATWIAPKAANMAYPEMHFTMSNKVAAQAAMFEDARATQRSLMAPIDDDADIERQYNYPLTYDKGAGILSMFENYIGVKSFQQGLRNYFARHAFGTATAEDFMRAVAESTGNFDMPGSINTFLRQPGVPHLQIQEHCSQGKLQLQIRQSRYLILGSDPVEKTNWKIPFCVSTGEGEENKLCRVIEHESTQWSLPFDCQASLMPNANGAGYFYWTLSKPMLDRLLTRLPQMNAPEALDIAANISAAFASGQINANEFLMYIPALTRHWHPHVISHLRADVFWILMHAVSADQRNVVLSYLRKYFSARVSDIAITPQAQYSLESYFLRTSIYPFVSLVLEDERLLNNLLHASRKQFGRDWKQTEQAGFIAPDLIPSALMAIVLTHPRVGADALLYRLSKEDNYYQRMYLIDALAFSKDPYVIDKLHGLLDGDLLAPDEKQGLFELLISSYNHNYHMDWIMANFDRLIDLIPEQRRKLIPISMARLCDSKQLARERAFYLDQHKLIQNGEFDFMGGLEAARQCIALRAAQPPLDLEVLREHSH